MTGKNGRSRAWQVLSFWALLAKSSIYKIFGTLILMVPAEGVCVYRYLKNGQELTPAQAAGGSGISVVFFAALGVILLILARSQGTLREKSPNTLGRLGLSDRGIFCVQTVYNLFCLWMLFMVQIWTAIGLVWYSAERLGGGVPVSFSLFLSFYQSDFLHCLLPMAEIWKWVRNLFLLAAFSLAAGAGFGKRYYAVLNLLFVITAVWFVSPIGGNFLDMVCILVYGITIAVNLRRLLTANVPESSGK